MQPSPEDAPRPIPIFARVFCGVLGVCSLLMATYVGFAVHPLLWEQMLVVLGLLCSASAFLYGAFTARWPLLTSFL